MARALPLGCLALMLAAGPAPAQTLDDFAAQARAAMPQTKATPLDQLLGPAEAAPLPPLADLPAPAPAAANAAAAAGGTAPLEPDAALLADLGLAGATPLDSFAPGPPAAPQDAALAQSQTPTEAAPDPSTPATVQPADPPADWVWHEVIGTSFAAPGDMMVMEEGDDNISLFRGTMNPPTGIILTLGTEGGPNDTFDEMLADMKDDGIMPGDTGTITFAGGAVFDWADISSVQDGIAMTARMFMSRDLFGEDEDVLMIAAGQIGDGERMDPAMRDAFLATIRLGPSVPRTSDEPATGGWIAQPATAQTVLGGVVQIPVPEGWALAADAETATLTAPGGIGTLRILRGAGARGIIAGIDPRAAMIPAWMADGMVQEYDSPDRVVLVWETCPAPDDPLVLEAVGAALLQDPGYAAILSHIAVALPPDALPCGTLIAPGDLGGPTDLPTGATALPAAPAPALGDTGQDTDQFTDLGGGYTTYRNGRYPMEVSYPGGYFMAQEAPGNGDGRSFVSVDGQARFHVFSQYDALDQGIDGMLAEARMLFDSITAETTRPGLFTISGPQGSDMTLHKVIRDSDGLTRTLVLTYPAARAGEFGPVAAYMADSFGPPPALDVALPPPPQAVAVPQPPSSAAVGQPPRPTATRTETPAIAGTWQLSVLNFSGTLTIRQGATGPEIIYNLGRDEMMRDVRYDPATGQIAFYRDLGDEHYVGTLRGNRIEGLFNHGAGSAYSYAWSATAPAGLVPAAPAAQVAGVWSIRTSTGYTGRLTIAEGPDGLAGHVYFDALRRDEILQDVSFDPATGALRFFRPDAGQEFRATVRGDTIEGEYNDAPGAPFRSGFQGSLTERFADPPPAAVTSDARMTEAPQVGRVTTPARNTPMRDMLLDTARVPIEDLLGLPVIFVVSVIRTDGHWAYLQGRPVNPDGSPINWARTPFGREIADGFMSDVAMVLMRRDRGQWQTVDYFFGPTDVAWYGWVEGMGLPERLFTN